MNCVTVFFFWLELNFQLRGLVQQTPEDLEPWFRFLLCCNLVDREPSGLFLALPCQEPLL